MDTSNNPRASENNRGKTFSETHKAKITQLKRNLTSLESLLGYGQKLGDLLQEKKKAFKESSKKVQDLEKELKDKRTELESKESLIEMKDSLIEEKDNIIHLRALEIEELKEKIQTMSNISDVVEKDLQEKNAKILELEEYYRNSDEINVMTHGIIKDMKKTLDQRESEIFNLKKEKESLKMSVDELKTSNNHFKSELKKKDKEISSLNAMIEKLKEEKKSDKNTNSSGISREVYSLEQAKKRKFGFDDSDDLRGSGPKGLHDSQLSKKIVRTEESKKYTYTISYNKNSLSRFYQGQKCIKIKTNDLEFLRLATQVSQSIFGALLTIALKKKIEKRRKTNLHYSDFHHVLRAGWDEGCMKRYVPSVINNLIQFNSLSQTSGMIDYLNSNDAVGDLRFITANKNSDAFIKTREDLAGKICEDYKNCNPNHKIQLLEAKSLFADKEVGDDVKRECDQLKEVFKSIILHHKAINNNRDKPFIVI
jgi:hypothetical protein